MADQPHAEGHTEQSIRELNGECHQQCGNGSEQPHTGRLVIVSMQGKTFVHFFCCISNATNFSFVPLACDLGCDSFINNQPFDYSGCILSTNVFICTKNGLKILLFIYIDIKT